MSSSETPRGDLEEEVVQAAVKPRTPRSRAVHAGTNTQFASRWVGEAVVKGLVAIHWWAAPLAVLSGVLALSTINLDQVPHITGLHLVGVAAGIVVVVVLLWLWLKLRKLFGQAGVISTVGAVFGVLAIVAGLVLVRATVPWLFVGIMVDFVVFLVFAGVLAHREAAIAQKVEAAQRAEFERATQEENLQRMSDYFKGSFESLGEASSRAQSAVADAEALRDGLNQSLAFSQQTAAAISQTASQAADAARSIAIKKADRREELAKAVAAERAKHLEDWDSDARAKFGEELQATIQQREADVLNQARGEADSQVRLLQEEHDKAWAAMQERHTAEIASLEAIIDGLTIRVGGTQLAQDLAGSDFSETPIGVDEDETEEPTQAQGPSVADQVFGFLGTKRSGRG